MSENNFVPDSSKFVPLNMQVALTTYRDLMYSVKLRIAYINSVIHDRTLQPDFIMVENCFLQFRHICELICLGCLALHGSDMNSDKIEKAWSPKLITRELTKFYPGYYMIPLIRSESRKEILEFRGDFLNEQKLLELYGRAQDVMHSGNLQDFKRRKMTPIGFEIVNWLNLIVPIASHSIVVRKEKLGWFELEMNCFEFDDHVSVTYVDGPS